PEVVSDLAIDRPVYFYDQLGSGRSDRATTMRLYSADHYVEELAEVLHALQLHAYVLLGFSWGAGLVTSFALEKQPIGLKGLILSGPLLSAPRWMSDQRKNMKTLPLGVVETIEACEKKSDFGDAYQEAMMAYYRQYIYRKDPWPASLMNALGMLNPDVYLTMWGPSEFTVTGNLKTFDLSGRLHEIAVPVLLTCGQYDEARVETVRGFQQAFRQALVEVLPDSAHMHHLEQPILYKSAVNKFLQSKCL
ncbi:MAG: proline iminopeptidase-family hydrolase, partial [Bacilli bacterium]